MKTQRRHWHSTSGMTLIEILLVLALLGTVLSIIGGRAFKSFSRGKIDATKIQIKKLESDLDRYRVDCNKYPTSAEGLGALIKNPGSCKNYDNLGYVDKEPTDAWGNKFAYQCEDGIHYKIISLGADGQEGGEGENADISSEEAK